MNNRSNTAHLGPVLTVAIPAYNVALYLEECVNSLILTRSAQDKLEIIIIDDGSKDETRSIAEQIAAKHQNIKLITKPNGGHGSTINAGLQAATGKYFKLLDGDDWFDTSSLMTLLNYLEHAKADIVLSDYVEFYSNSSTTRPIHNYENLSPGIIYHINKENPFQTKGPLLATTTFKTSLFKKDPFVIDEHCFYVDMEYNLFIYQRAQTIEYLPLDLYFYRLEREGQSMQLSSIKRNFKNHEKVLLRICSELTTLKSIDVKYSYLLQNLVVPMTRTHYQILTEYIGSPRLFNEFDRKLKIYPEVYQSPLVSGKIIGIHRASRGATVVFDVLLRKLGGVVKSLEKK